jgi:hypothetical protein
MEIYRKYAGTIPGPVYMVPDRFLRPITPPPGSVTEDEVLELWETREPEIVR